MLEGSPMRFRNKQEAVDRAEMLNATSKMNAARNMKVADTTYIVVEDSV